MRPPFFYKVCLLPLFIVVLAGSCKKSNQVNPVSGTINGTPTITIYGNNNVASDYILLSTDSSKNILAYGGTVLNFQISVPDSLIFITLPSGMVARAALYRTKTSAQLNVSASAPAYFRSQHYVSY